MGSAGACTTALSMTSAAFMASRWPMANEYPLQMPSAMTSALAMQMSHLARLLGPALEDVGPLIFEVDMGSLCCRGRR